MRFKLNLDKLGPSQLAKGLETYQAMSKRQSDARVALGRDSKIKDVYGFVLDAKDPSTGKPLTSSQLVSETGLLITAGGP